MLEKIQELLNQISKESLDGLEKTENFRVRYLGSKGVLKDLYQQLKTVPAEQKPAVGHALNTLRQEIESRVDAALS